VTAIWMGYYGSMGKVPISSCVVGCVYYVDMDPRYMSYYFSTCIGWFISPSARSSLHVCTSLIKGNRP
jgi:hypothetical protein